MSVVPGQFDDAPDEDNTNTTAASKSRKNEDQSKKDGLRMLSIIASDSKGDKTPDGKAKADMTTHDSDKTPSPSDSNNSGGGTNTSNNCPNAFLRNAVNIIYGEKTDLETAGELLNASPGSLRINHHSQAAVFRYLGASTGRGRGSAVAKYHSTAKPAQPFPELGAGAQGQVQAPSNVPPHHLPYPPAGHYPHHPHAYPYGYAAPLVPVPAPAAVQSKDDEKVAASGPAPVATASIPTVKIDADTSSTDSNRNPRSTIDDTGAIVEGEASASSAPTAAASATPTSIPPVAPAPASSYYPPHPPHFMNSYGSHPGNYGGHHPHFHPHHGHAHPQAHYPPQFAAAPSSYPPAANSKNTKSQPNARGVAQHPGGPPSAHVPPPPHPYAPVSHHGPVASSMPLHAPMNTNMYFISTSSINENDVLCGRGGLTNQHLGNKKFRALVKQLQEKYITRKKHEKTLLSQAVVAVVRGSSPAGRFLKQDVQTGMWYDIGDEMATEKTSQAFREKSKVKPVGKVRQLPLPSSADTDVSNKKLKTDMNDI